MVEILQQAYVGYLAKSALELIAVVLGLAYLLLAMRENFWCWPAAFVSTAIYVFIFWDVSLLMDSALNVYYMGMAVYGAWMWTRGGADHHGKKIERWSWRLHLGVISVVLVISLISGFLLDMKTNAAWPYLDSFTTWSSLITTYMVARKVLENWLYWIVIDSVALMLYLERGLYPTAALFALYLILCVFGFLAWLKHWRSDQEGGKKSVEGANTRTGLIGE